MVRLNYCGKCLVLYQKLLASLYVGFRSCSAECQRQLNRDHQQSIWSRLPEAENLRLETRSLHFSLGTTFYGFHGKNDFFFNLTFERRNIFFIYLLRFVDCASMYNLVNKANLVHNLFLVYLSIFTCFGRLWGPSPEETTVSVCRVHTRQSSTQNDKYQVSHEHSCFS